MAIKRSRGRPKVKNPASKLYCFRHTPDRMERYKSAAKKSGKKNVSVWLKDLADSASE